MTAHAEPHYTKLNPTVH